MKMVFKSVAWFETKSSQIGDVPVSAGMGTGGETVRRKKRPKVDAEMCTRAGKLNKGAEQ